MPGRLARIGRRRDVAELRLRPRPHQRDDQQELLRRRNLLLAKTPITVECQVNDTDGHVCCNNTVARNAISAPNASAAREYGADFRTAVQLELIGDNTTDACFGSTVDFNTVLKLKVQADDGPARASLPVPVGPGTEIDFFGQAREGMVEAGPFAHVTGGTHVYQLWPPPR